MSAPDWAIVADDPEWELRQGPQADRLLSDGSLIVATLVWTSDAGYAVNLTLDGEPVGVAELSLERVAAVAAVTAEIVAAWPVSW